MSEVYAVTVPKITAAALEPDPVETGGEIFIAVTVVEETVYLEPTVYYSGEFYSGEV